MPKTRLNQSLRTQLIGLASKLIMCPEEQRHYDRCFGAAYAIVRKACDLRFPPEDMAVLKRYGKVSTWDVMKVRLENGQVFEFKVSESKHFFVHPENNWNTIVLIEGSKNSDAISRYADARAALKKAKAAKLSDYEALVHASRTLEDVVEVWPEASAVKPNYKPLVALNPEAIKRIQLDVQKRQKQRRRDPVTPEASSPYAEPYPERPTPM